MVFGSTGVGGGASPLTTAPSNARRRRRIGYAPSNGDSARNGGLVGAMLRRQSTGMRGAGGGDFLFRREILHAQGHFKKRMREALEGVPEMIVDIRKALTSDNSGALFVAVRAILTKLVEGTSASFDMPTRQDSSTSTSARHAGSNHHGHAHGASGGDGDGTGGDGHHHGGGGGGGGGNRHGSDEDDDPFHPNGYPRVRRLDRDVFVALGGPELLIEVLRRPRSPADARLIPADIVAQDTPVWNITLFVLRELCFTDQDLSERLGSSELILFLLTMMGHPGVFDNAVALVEEILAVKTNTYFLGEVPELHSLMDNMSSQQLAHFSRVLALLVFEPEYRQLMESAHVLRSMELLQLRRDRVGRADSVIDKNQALVLSAPNLLPRLMELLRIMNYNPPLAMFDEHHGFEIPDQHFDHIRIRVSGGEIGDEDRRRLQAEVASEWTYFSELRAIAGADSMTAGQAGLNGAGPAAESSRQESQRQRSGANGSPASSGESRIANIFRSIFRRNSNNSNNSQRSDAAAGNNSAAAAGVDTSGRGGPIGETYGGAAAAWRLEGGGGGGPLAAVGTIGANGSGTEGLANFAMRDLINFLNPAFAAPNAAESMVSFERALAWSVGGSMAATIGGGSGGGSGGRVRGRRRLQLPSAEEAREELQFNGLLLAPHQVEVLFVLCTLLGARRKGEAHETLANLGLIEILDSMFDRLSWGVPSRQEGPHGANCDCNPESALRVQYLRLVHNFLDRDSNNNPLKRLLLSSHERELFATGRFMANPNGSGNVVFVKSDASESDPPQSPFVWRGRTSSGVAGESDEEKAKWVDTRGLLSKIVDVFMKEPMDSLYRFWLASCVEAFLRGGTTQEQLFIAGGGLLGHLVKEITSDGVWCAGSLQTAFDLLGELCKGNREVLEMLEANMTDKQLRRFLEVMVDNLVDSNVFMRSLVLSVEHSAFRRGMVRGCGSGHVGRGRGPGSASPPLQSRSDKKTADTAGLGSAVVTEEICGEECKSREGSGDDRSEGMSERGEDEDDACADEEGFQGLGAGEEPCYLGHTWFDVQSREISLTLDDAEEMEESEEEGDEDQRIRVSQGDRESCTPTSASAGVCASGKAKARRSSPSLSPSKEAAACTLTADGTLSDVVRSTERDGLSGSGDSMTEGSSDTNAFLGTKENSQEGADVSGARVARGQERRQCSGEQPTSVVTAVKGEKAMRCAGSGGLAGLTRLQVFLKHNTPQLVRDLMGVVNLETINHENICCLNTVILILIFADRRGELAEVLQEVRRLPAGKKVSDVEDDDDDDDHLHETESKQGDEEDEETETTIESLIGSYSRARRRRAYNSKMSSNGSDHAADGGVGGSDAVDAADMPPPADGHTVLQGFRRLLWFWGEYYMRGGRDRLSLEFSTHVKFWAWKRVIRLLCADDGSPTSLVAAPLRLPRSPYDTVPLPPPRTA